MTRDQAVQTAAEVIDERRQASPLELAEAVLDALAAAGLSLDAG